MTELTPLNYSPQQRTTYQGVLPSASTGAGLPDFMNELVLDSPNPKNLKCYHCRKIGKTKILKHNYYFTRGWAVLLCLFGCICCCWLPLVLDSCKEHHHYCSSCNKRIGVYTRYQNHNESHISIH